MPASPVTSRRRRCPAGTEADIDHWIRLAYTQAGAAGFVTNLGGVLTLPISLPANFVGTTAVQMRMIAKIGGGARLTTCRAMR